MIELIGWLGGIAFALCGLPAAIQVYKQKHAEGYSKAFIGLWLIGEILTMAYVYLSKGFDGPLFLNYILNLVFISVIVYYMLRGKNVQSS